MHKDILVIYFRNEQIHLSKEHNSTNFIPTVAIEEKDLGPQKV